MSYVAATELPGLKVGDQVFMIITPETPNGFLRSYRHRPYFVLETKIQEVREGGKRYILATSYFGLPGRVFTDPTKAKEKLVEVFAEQTDGTIAIDKVRLISAEEEKVGARAESEKPFKDLARA